ncbi:CLATHRIN ASSEMBLY PROTEIN, partial [Salix koriyanagi]
MSGGGTQNSLRRALGALKDSTTVSLAKVNSDYKELDIAIVKATNHYERPARVLLPFQLPDLALMLRIASMLLLGVYQGL